MQLRSRGSSGLFWAVSSWNDDVDVVAAIAAVVRDVTTVGMMITFTDPGMLQIWGADEEIEKEVGKQSTILDLEIKYQIKKKI